MIRDRCTAWLALLGIALLALGAAVFTARRQARALAEPLEDPSRTCRAVTDGDLAPAQQPLPVPAALESLGRLLDDLENRWHGLSARDGRRLDIPVAPELRSIPVPGRPLARILDVLLDNARGHGSVEVSAWDLADAIALGVRDEGAIHADPAALFERREGSGAGRAVVIRRSIHPRGGKTPDRGGVPRGGTGVTQPDSKAPMGGC
ncbi:hypothetical protein [Streptomyces yanii]|uniref:Histidine kinase n=1 Tax=Streptomyces yanii TaxID=78510 RepID=A0ABV5RPG8_9ACTN